MQAMADSTEYTCNFVDAAGAGQPGFLTLTFLDGSGAKHGALHQALAPHAAEPAATSTPYPTDAFPISVGLRIPGLDIQTVLTGLFLVSTLGPPIVAMAVTPGAAHFSTQFGLIKSDGSEIGGWLASTDGRGPWSFLGTR
jgi:hypothetical protein